MQQLQEDASRKVMKQKEVTPPNFDIHIRDQIIETIHQLSYHGCYVTRDYSLDKEIATRLSKTSIVLNMLCRIIWYRKVSHLNRNYASFTHVFYQSFSKEVTQWDPEKKSPSLVLTCESCGRYKPPRGMGVRKKWEDKVISDLNRFQIRNWRRETLNWDTWWSRIIEHVQIRPPFNHVTVVMQQLKHSA